MISLNINAPLVFWNNQKNTKSPPTHLRWRVWIVCRPMPAAEGFRFTELHSRAALRSLSDPSLGDPHKSASIHSILLRPAPSFYFAPLWLFLSIIQLTQPKRKASFHSTQFAKFHSVTILAFAGQSALCPTKCSDLKIISHKSPTTLLMCR